MTAVSRRSSKAGRARVPRTPTRIIAFPTSPDRARAVRRARVATARARVASGYYDRLDVQEVVAGALIDELNRS